VTSGTPFWSPTTVAQAAGGRWLRPPAWDQPTTRLRVSTDSRQVQAGEIFLALAGEQFDGHRFVEHAAAQGAQAVVVHDESAALALSQDCATGVLLVPETLHALTGLARAHRETLGGVRIVGITGSNGKTTTKRLLHAALATKLTGTASPKSFNNHLGVPLTILGAEPTDDYLVAEIGSNAPGEIATLSELIRPFLGVITGIGQSHLQGLGTLEGVLAEKLALLRELPKDGLAIVNADAPRLLDAIANDPQLAGLSTIRYGLDTSDVDLRGTGTTCDADGVSYSVGKSPARLALLGRHNVLNALAALAAAEALGVDRSTALAALEAVEPSDMRLVAKRVGDRLLVNDAYNANPDSMGSALHTFVDITTDDRRRVLVLGDMLELGESAERAHADLAREIVALERAGHTIHLIVLIGELVQTTAAMLAQEQSNAAVLPFPDGLDETSLPQILAMIARDDQILIKGSRLLELERLAERLADTERTKAQGANDECPMTND
jgi:UDP-N-acetylmuramoyl-tripeptide--D-alanyl-D-alanine ligase